MPAAATSMAFSACSALVGRFSLVAAAFLLILRLAMPFSFLSVAFSYLRFMLTTLATSGRPISRAQATSVP